jgi:hypothetical protein
MADAREHGDEASASIRCEEFEWLRAIDS